MQSTIVSSAKSAGLDALDDRLPVYPNVDLTPGSLKKAYFHSWLSTYSFRLTLQDSDQHS